MVQATSRVGVCLHSAFGVCKTKRCLSWLLENHWARREKHSCNIQTSTLNFYLVFQDYQQSKGVFRRGFGLSGASSAHPSLRLDSLNESAQCRLLAPCPSYCCLTLSVLFVEGLLETSTITMSSEFYFSYVNILTIKQLNVSVAVRFALWRCAPLISVRHS